MFRFACLLSILCAAASAQPQRRLLWPGGAPGALGQEAADHPAITSYIPERPNGTAVVVCPGGGYQHLAMDHEGRQIAEWLNARGVTAFVLEYRLGPRYHHPAMLQDVQRAIRTVRAGAAEFHIQPDRIGVWGFSAGGHLASSAGTHFDAGNAASADPIERVSSRPDFMVLAYPVISMHPGITHAGSRRNLLGENPDSRLETLMSNDEQVTKETPPTFLFHTTDDPVVPVENALLFYSALHRAGVPAEMHIYEHGKHGVGLAQTDPALSTWPMLLEEWLKQRGLIASSSTCLHSGSGE